MTASKSDSCKTYVSNSHIVESKPSERNMVQSAASRARRGSVKLSGGAKASIVEFIGAFCVLQTWDVAKPSALRHYLGRILGFGDLPR